MLLRLPRFRSTARDKATDEARTRPISKAIELAVRNAEREIEGLSARLLLIRSEAALTFDSYEDITVREEQEEERISSVESRLLAAELRLNDLKVHRAKLHELQDAFLARFGTEDTGAKIPS